MFIFLDESYNLSDRNLPQFVSINGFMVVDARKVWKRWMEYRRKFAGKWRIHASDKVFEPLREKSFRLAQSLPDMTLVSVVQTISDILVGKDSPYYQKGKLNFDKVYEDMLKYLFDKLHFHAYKQVSITIDSRKTKSGRLGKRQLRERILAYLAQYYPTTQVSFNPIPSSSSVLLEIADFISNTFYKQYTGQASELLQQIKGKTIVLKNPLERG